MKGTMLPQASAHFDEKHFWNRWPNFFKYRRSVQEAVFIFGKLAEVFIYKPSLVITEAICCDSFESFCNAEKQKYRDATTCMKISLNRTLLRMCPSWRLVPITAAIIGLIMDPGF